MATVSELQARLDNYLAAEAAILGGAQSYTVNGRTVTKANMMWIKQQIDMLENRIAFASGSSHGHAVFGR